MSTSDSGAGRVETTSAQDAFWWLEQQAPDSPVSTVSRVYRVTGDLDVGALRAAWRAVVRRHDILRTTLAEQDGRVVAHIAEPGDELPSFVDIGTVRFAHPEAVHRWCVRQATVRLRLPDGPMARLTVVRLGAREYGIAVVAHRAAVDDESMSILLHELSSGYSAAMSGSADVPPELPAQYADFARWQRDLATTPRYARLLDWWTSAIDSAPPALTLPVDRTRPPTPSSSGGVVRFEWDEQVHGPLAELSASAGTTPDIVVLTAFLALLGRYGGTERVAVGVPLQVRPHPELDLVIGQFENVVVLDADLAGRPTFRELVDRVAAGATQAAGHRELPFDALMRALDAHRDPRRLPLCDAMFVCQQGPVTELFLPGVVVVREDVDTGSASTDLTLTLRRSEPTVAGTLEFRDCLFDQASAELMLGQLRTMLVAALREPHRPVGELPLDDRYRLRASVREADRIAAALQDARPAHELCHASARRRPDAVALTWHGTDVTYRELERRAASVASAVADRRGAPVVVRMPPGPRQVAAMLGVLDAGAHLVCADRDDTGDHGTVFDATVLDLPDTPRPAVGLAEWAYVSYTSGARKGIPHTHAAFGQFVTWFAREFGIRPGSRVAQWAPPGDDAGLCEVFATLCGGATLCPVPDRIRRRPGLLVDWLAEQRITTFRTTPEFALRLLRVVDGRGSAHRLAALDHLLLAGGTVSDVLANGLRAALPSARLVTLYGPPESIRATWHEITRPVHGTAPIGRPIPGRQVLLLDELDRPCPTGVVGHIVLRSPYLTAGYLGGTATDRFAFTMLDGLTGFGVDGGTCFRTGDLGRRRWDGALELVGRSGVELDVGRTVPVEVRPVDREQGGAAA